MASSYYFNLDERNFSVRAPTISKQEKFDMMSEDDKWHDYMRENHYVKPCVEHHTSMYQKDILKYDVIKSNLDKADDFQERYYEDADSDDDDDCGEEETEAAETCADADTCAETCADKKKKP